MGTINTCNKTTTDLITEMPEVSRHCLRVGSLAYQFGVELGLSKKRCHELYIAGKEHDLGKLFVDKAILNAPRRLTDEEKAAINMHTSSECLDKCTFSSALSKTVALEHHKDSKEICLESQIIAICDVFDALTSPRSYDRESGGTVVKESVKGFSYEDALDIMTTDPRQTVLNKDLLLRFEEFINPYEFITELY